MIKIFIKFKGLKQDIRFKFYPIKQKVKGGIR